MKNDHTMHHSGFLQTIPEPFLLQNILQEDCSRGSEGLLCHDQLSQVFTKDDLIEKELVIFFLDIRDFTGLLQAGSNLETVPLVKRLLNLFSRVISSFGGRLVDRSGDNLYAVFGLESSINQAADSAFQSAKMIFELLEHINASLFNAKFGYNLQIGIGIHAGTVIIEDKIEDREFSVMGLPVNIAARLQTETKNLDNDLIISESLYQLLSAKFKSGIGARQTKVYVAGIKDPQTVWLAGQCYRCLSSKTGPDDFLNYILAIAG